MYRAVSGRWWGFVRQDRSTGKLRSPRPGLSPDGASRTTSKRRRTSGPSRWRWRSVGGRERVGYGTLAKVVCPFAVTYGGTPGLKPVCRFPRQVSIPLFAPQRLLARLAGVQSLVRIPPGPDDFFLALPSFLLGRCRGKLWTGVFVQPTKSRKPRGSGFPGQKLEIVLAQRFRSTLSSAQPRFKSRFRSKPNGGGSTLVRIPVSFLYFLLPSSCGGSPHIYFRPRK